MEVAAMGEERDSGASRAPEAGAAISGRVPFVQLFKYADTCDVLLMVVGTAAAVANGFSEPLMTIIFGKVVDLGGVDASSSDFMPRVTKVVLDFVYLGIGTAVVSFLQIACWTMTGERQATRIRSLYLKAVLRQDIAFFDMELTTGQVVARMSGDTVLIQDAIGEKVSKFLQLVSTFIGGFVVAFAKGWLLAAIMLPCIPPVVITGGIVSYTLSKISSKGLAAYGDAGNVVEQTLGAIKTVVSFNGEKRAVMAYNEFIRKVYKVAVQEGLAGGLGLGVIFFTFFSSYGLAIWYGAKLIDRNHYTAGNIINVLFAIMTGATSLSNATPCLTIFAQGQSAAYRIFEMIKREPLIDVNDMSGLMLGDIRGNVELRDVHFSYPTRPDQPVFQGFSLQVSSGMTMAIVGESGSGKSTVISLVQRFYDPQAGSVLMDGVDIRSLRLDWIRGKIGLVSQEPMLFMMTIKENMKYGKPDATDEEIRRAAELANAAKFIDKLPDGYDTMVGQRGAQLSGGQKQRVAIARAILKNPRVLLLDEATSALDIESERTVQEALNRIMVERTTIIVAHRLSTVRNAECISVIHQGKIVEQGPHSELIKNPDGAYSQLIRLQEAHHDNGPRQSEAGTSKVRLAGRNSALKRSVSTGSSGRGNSSRHSFTIPFPLAGSMAVADNGGMNDNLDEPETLMEAEGKPLKKAPLRKLVNLNKPEVHVILLGSLAATVHGVVFPVFGIMIANIIKTFYEPEPLLGRDSRFWALMCFVLGLVALVAIPSEYLLFSIAGSKLIERIRSLCFWHIVHQEVGWFDDPANSSGAIGARLSVDALNVRRLVGDNLALTVQFVAILVTGVVMAMVANWKLTLIIICVAPLIGVQAFVQVKFLKGFSSDAKVLYEEASQVATDAIGSIRTVASFCAENRVMAMYEERCRASMQQGIRTGYVSGLGFGFAFLMLYFTYAFSFYVGARFVHSGETNFIEVFKVFFALALATIGISQNSAMASDSTKAKDSAISIFAILDRESRIDSRSDSGVVLDNVKGDVEFREVSFKYPSRPDVQIFSDFSLAIHASKTVALVGQSGSGKSTAIALLERFYDPQAGAIFLDGVEISRLKVSWLREQMGLVSQEPVLFNDTIRANIAYGKQGETSEEEIVAAAKAANAHEFVSALPSSYDTTVGERGVQLSGGQKQRVAIARAIIKDPRILLLDEATSALDAESERVVQAALDSVMVGRTTVVVAHRLTTIKNADIIAVLKDGAVAEKGCHEALMAIDGGIYASLVDLQSSSSGT